MEELYFLCMCTYMCVCVCLCVWTVFPSVLHKKQGKQPVILSLEASVLQFWLCTSSSSNAETLLRLKCLFGRNQGNKPLWISVNLMECGIQWSFWCFVASHCWRLIRSYQKRLPAQQLPFYLVVVIYLAIHPFSLWNLPIPDNENDCKAGIKAQACMHNGVRMQRGRRGLGKSSYFSLFFSCANPFSCN